MAPVSPPHLEGIDKLVRVVPRENDGAFRRHVALADDVNLDKATRWTVSTVKVVVGYISQETQKRERYTDRYVLIIAHTF